MLEMSGVFAARGTNAISVLPALRTDQTFFSGLDSLRVLTLASNSFASFPLSIVGPLQTRLEGLYLDNNGLTEFVSALPGSDTLSMSLKVLSMINNQITSLPATVFKTFPNIEFINLRNNGISELPFYFFANVSDNFSGILLDTPGIDTPKLQLFVGPLPDEPNKIAFGSSTGLPDRHLG